MKVLVTGSNGFIGKNLIERLSRVENVEVFKFDKNNTTDDLENYIEKTDFIFHLAGINRPENIEEFYEGNSGLTERIISIVEKLDRAISILISSSTQAEFDNDYGKSKLGSEEALRSYAQKTGASIFIYRLPNVFGKWCKPNYNSVVATWCYNITHDIPLQINDKNTLLTLVYIDDVVESFVSHLNDKSSNLECHIGTTYQKNLGKIASLLEEFKESRTSLIVPKVGNGFEKALYGTYLSYLPTDKFSYELKGHSDQRGTFYEILKTLDSGQFSISTTKPGDIVRGNHYHNTKNEKFLLVKGEAIIELRDINSDEVIEYKVSDEKMEIVEMIPGYTHNIMNISNEEMILLIWANEAYNHDKPDTYYLEV
jgi:UDP-2-acetamido-2,6-beta-L-arabino-hexul-4-ose reductase